MRLYTRERLILRIEKLQVCCGKCLVASVLWQVASAQVPRYILLRNFTNLAKFSKHIHEHLVAKIVRCYPDQTGNQSASILMSLKKFVIPPSQ